MGRPPRLWRLRVNQSNPLEHAQITFDAYILGPGDSLEIELPIRAKRILSIGPDGTLYLPRLRALYVGGLTVEELRKT